MYRCSSSGVRARSWIPIERANPPFVVLFHRIACTFSRMHLSWTNGGGGEGLHIRAGVPFIRLVTRTRSAATYYEARLPSSGWSARGRGLEALCVILAPALTRRIFHASHFLVTNPKSSLAAGLPAKACLPCRFLRAATV